MTAATQISRFPFDRSSLGGLPPGFKPGFDVLHVPGLELAIADCRHTLPALPDGCVNEVVTSIPYWGLRNYKGEALQIGLEKTPFDWIREIVDVFALVHRVLHESGTCWINVGDAYWGSGRGGGRIENPDRVKYGTHARHPDGAATRCPSCAGLGSHPFVDGCKADLLTLDLDRHSRLEWRTCALCDGSRAIPVYVEKELMLLPHRLAVALQDWRGPNGEHWLVRSDCIWAKPNPKPMSRRDAPTTAHEHFFMLAKQPHYFFDTDAKGWRKPYSQAALDRRNYVERTGNVGTRTMSHQPGQEGTERNPSPKNDHAYYDANRDGANRTDVFSVARTSFKGMHTATYPLALIEPILAAGLSEKGVCPRCRAPWVRVVGKRERAPEEIANMLARWGANADGEYHGSALKDYDADGAESPGEIKKRMLKAARFERVTMGWRPGCGCSPHESVRSRTWCTCPDSADTGIPCPAGRCPWTLKSIIDTLGRGDLHSPVDGRPLCADPTCRHPHAPSDTHSGVCGKCRCEIFRWGDPYAPVPPVVLDPFAGMLTTAIAADRRGAHSLMVELHEAYALDAMQRFLMDRSRREHGIPEGKASPPTPREAQAMAAQRRLFE